MSKIAVVGDDPLVEDYGAIEEKTVFVEPDKGVVKEFHDLTPWEQIVESSKRYSISIKPPKKNCKKCFGRGYTGMSIEGANKIPVACKCIFNNQK